MERSLLSDGNNEYSRSVASSGAGFAGSADGVSKALAFGGGESVEVDSFDSFGRSRRGAGAEVLPHDWASRSSVGGSEEGRLSFADGDASASVATSYASELDTDTATAVAPPPAEEGAHKCTPPRAPPLGRASPALSASPSAHKLASAQGKVVPAQIVLPGEKDGARLRVSPTSSRKHSAFARKLQEAEAGEEEAVSPQRQPPSASKLGEGAPAVDEWKEARTDKGKKYYYNRRTRQSSWRLPENAIFVKPSSGTDSTGNRDGSADESSVTHQKASLADETPPGHCAQLRQRQEQQLEQEKAAPPAAAGGHVFCLFCGVQASALAEPFLLHLHSCAGKHSDTNSSDLQAISTLLSQQQQQQQQQGGGDTSASEERSQDYQEDVRCATCSRTFADEAKLGRHAPSCLQASRNKVTPYDGRRKRILGTAMEHSTHSAALSSPHHGGPSSPTVRTPGTPNSNGRGRRPASSPEKSYLSYSSTSHASNNNYSPGHAAPAPVSAAVAAAKREHVCPKCACASASNDLLLRHLRVCLLEDVPVGAARNVVSQAGTTKEAEAEGLHACPFCAKRNGSGAGLTRHLALCAKKRAAANRPGAKK
jgi:hypothetical protein